MLKTLKKDLNADVSAATAKKVMDALRTDFWTEDFRDLPKGTEGVILTLSYSVPDVKVRPKVGEAIDWDKHELRVGDRVEHPILLDWDGNHQGTVVVKEVRLRSFTYDKRGLGVCWGCDNKTWIFRGEALAHPEIGEKIFFFKHELKIGDFIKGPYDSDVYEVIACRKNEYDVKNVVSGTVIQAYASDYWVRVEKPVLGLKVKVGDRVRWTSGDEWTEGRVYEVTSSYFKYIRDKVGNTDLRVGEVAAFPLVNGVYLDKNVKVIAD